jgi:prepilin-type N-terminal cleavage/methylation domain-containing protein
MRCRSRGFSLTEILVVVAIIGLAVAITVPLVAENVNQPASVPPPTSSRWTCGRRA